MTASRNAESIPTFELFNLFSLRPDWVLDIPGPRRIRMTGTVAAPALPGPSDLVVAYIDEPRGYTFPASAAPIASTLRVLRIDVARVRVEGKVTVEDLALDIEVEAALVT